MLAYQDEKGENHEKWLTVFLAILTVFCLLTPQSVNGDTNENNLEEKIFLELK